MCAFCPVAGSTFKEEPKHVSLLPGSEKTGSDIALSWTCPCFPFVKTLGYVGLGLIIVKASGNSINPKAFKNNQLRALQTPYGPLSQRIRCTIHRVFEVLHVCHSQHTPRVTRRSLNTVRVGGRQKSYLLWATSVPSPPDLCVLIPNPRKWLHSQKEPFERDLRLHNRLWASLSNIQRRGHRVRNKEKEQDVSVIH